MQVSNYKPGAAFPACRHHGSVVCIIIIISLLPWESVKTTLRRPALFPSIQALSTLGRMSSGDSFRGQPLLQPYAPEVSCSRSLDTSHGAFSQYRAVFLPACQHSSVGWLAGWQSVCARVPSLHLSPAGWENPGALCQPCGETFLDVFGWFSRRADPDRQSDDGRPLLFSRPCRRVCVSICICTLLVCPRLAAFCTC